MDRKGQKLTLVERLKAKALEARLRRRWATDGAWRDKVRLAVREGVNQQYNAQHETH